MHGRFTIVCVFPVVLAAFTAINVRAADTTASGLSAAELARRIDAAIDAKLQAEGVQPAPQADDAEFFRRAYLDLTGRIPPAGKTAAFLDDRRSDKRERLIDELLASPAFGRHMADVWESLLITRTSDNRIVDFEPLRTWLETAFNRDKPWNEMVHDLLTASGTPEENGAVVYFLANQPVDKVTDNVSKMFLGVQLQCAQCHNHPFTNWKQTEYWGMAAFFLKVRAQQPRPMKMAQGQTPSVSESDKLPRGKRGLPDSAKLVPAKFLGGIEPSISSGEPLRPVLAAWLTASDNPYFSRAMVNRTWAQLFGRGLVNPVDDMHDANTASHPELLNELAGQFANGGFDLKHLFRALCNTQAYQRTSKASESKADVPPELYSRMAVKVLTPEQMFDSLTTVLGNPANNPNANPQAKKKNNNNNGVFGAKNNKNLKGAFGVAKEVNKDTKDTTKKDVVMALRQQMNSPRNLFVNFFKVEDADPTEYQAGIPQALRMMNGPQMNNAMANSPLVRANKPVSQAVQDLYLATLARRPTASELGRASAYVNQQRETRQGLSDVLWALLNSSEFSLNH